MITTDMSAKFMEVVQLPGGREVNTGNHNKHEAQIPESLRLAEYLVRFSIIKISMAVRSTASTAKTSLELLRHR